MEYVTITQAARTLRVNRLTIRRWIEAGKLTATLVGRTKFIPSSEVEIKKKEREVQWKSKSS